jgi:tetratricopeptide (TPR) repeat protein
MARKSSMSAHQPEEPRETLEDRWLLEAQTARNLEGLAAEQAGQVDEAIALYERNVLEGFPGDLPYGRLVALYERRGALGEAERVLRRAIEVFSASGRRTPRDRRATIRVFKNRLALLEDLRRAQRVQEQDQ